MHQGVEKQLKQTLVITLISDDKNKIYIQKRIQRIHSSAEFEHNFSEPDHGCSRTTFLLRRAGKVREFFSCEHVQAKIIELETT